MAKPDMDSARAGRLVEQGQLVAAAEILKDLLRRWPQHPAANYWWARIAIARRQHRAAVEHLQIAVAAEPDNARFRAAWASCLRVMGDSQLAMVELRRIIDRSPSYEPAWLDLGRALLAARRFEEAIALLAEHRRLHPDSSEGITLLGRAYFESNDVAQSERCFEQALQLSTASVDTFLSAAQVCMEQGASEKAVEIYKRGLVAFPNAVELNLGLAQALEDLGDRSAAEQTYRRALELNPGRGYTIGSLLDLLGARAEDALIAQAWKAMDGDSATDVARALIGYGLGKVHHAKGDSERAMQAWTLANQARRRETGPFDRARFSRRIDDLIQVFGDDFWAKHRKWGIDDHRPVFIVGMPRSGTTLIEQVIAAHPSGAGLGELPDVAKLASSFGRQLGSAWPFAAQNLMPEHVKLEAHRHLEMLVRRARNGALRIVDKAPLNFLHLGLIALIFPSAHIIWCRRDPRDVCLSIYSENFALQQKHATDLADLGFYFNEHERLMRHWQSSLAMGIHEVQYEDFVAAPEHHARALISGLRLEWNPQCLQFHEQPRAVQTPSRWQVRQPVYATSVERWRRYEPWLGPLIHSLASA